MSHSNIQNEPTRSEENGPIDEIDHRPWHGKHISDEKLKKFAIEKYEKNGLGTTYIDLIINFKVSKEKAQLRLKNGCKGKITTHGKQPPILFRSLDRKNPQQFFPFLKREKILKNWRLKQNMPLEPTGVRRYTTTDLVKSRARYVTELLTLLQNEPLSIHKIHLKLDFEKSYYDELIMDRFDKKDKIKIHEERIGFRNIKYHLYPNGTIMVYIRCTNYPFILSMEEDISSFFSFLGQVRDRLVYLLHDISEKIISPIMNWILVQCDVNADIPINIIEELSLPNIQLHILDRIFRLYVKYIDGNAVYRIEESKQINKPVRIGISQIMNSFNNQADEPYDPVKFQYIQ